MPKRLLKLQWLLDLENHNRGLLQWFRSQNILLIPQNVTEARSKYLALIKPVVHRYHQVVQRFKREEFAIVSDELNQEQIGRLTSLVSVAQLKGFTIISKVENTTNGQKNSAEGQQPHSKDEGLETMSQQQFQSLLLPPKHEIYKIPLSSPPNNQEYPYWHTHIPVPNGRLFTAPIIHGKGLAKKQLGFPTANLQVNSQTEQALMDQPNGIYLASVVLKGVGYFGIASIGGNPHYENSLKKLVEVYIYHEFEEEFYGCEIGLKVLTLVRFQGKFRSFQVFLQAMHNDIQVGRQLAKQYQM